MKPSDATTLPLCVHLEGIVRTDVATESLILLLKQDVLYFFRAVFWLCQGRAVLEQEIAKRSTLNPESLPYNLELIAWLHRERQRGRKIWLYSGANEKLASRIADHLALFDGVIASDSHTNLDGACCARRLVETFGYREFDYCGSGRGDMPAWQSAHAVVTVYSDPAVEEKAAGVAPILHRFPRLTSPRQALLRALRPHQWAKNILVFVPLLAAHHISNFSELMNASLAFIAFCLCASSVYLLNDLLDLEADRVHVGKSRRPFAAGDLPLATGLWLVPLLAVAAGFIASLLPREFAAALGAYYLLSLLYSFRIKEIMLLDAIALAALYTLRVIAGGLATHTPASFWLLLFSVFLFLSLAFAKRYAELDALQRARKRSAIGRSYNVRDLPLLESLGTGSGYMSVIVLALYVHSPGVETLYRNPEYIWALCVLLMYWIIRVWMKAHRGKMNEDPVLFAFRDRVSLSIGFVCALVLALAI